ncbi:uncharacterized protein TNCV_17311 [Trichonephila clavipes]|nr:uncharacterized protein TNCV_17311 [Trichonephila clavipes]
MKYLVIVLLVALIHCAAAESTEETKPAANQPAYQAAYQPYPYRSYSGYDNTYRSRYGSYGQYPSSNYDLGSQHLHLSGGIYRPYDYADDYEIREISTQHCDSVLV